MWRTYGALDSFSGAYPALADWANLWRTYGALEKGARESPRPLHKPESRRGCGPGLKPKILADFVAASEGAAPLTQVRGFHLCSGPGLSGAVWVCFTGAKSSRDGPRPLHSAKSGNEERSKQPLHWQKQVPPRGRDDNAGQKQVPPKGRDDNARLMPERRRGTGVGRSDTRTPADAPGAARETSDPGRNRASSSHSRGWRTR